MPTAIHRTKGRRLFVLLVATFWCVADPGFAQSKSPPVEGSWTGTYRCARGDIGATLTFNHRDDPSDTVRFHFFSIKGGPRVPQGRILYRYRASGQGRIEFEPIRWIERPQNGRAENFSGRITEPGHFVGKLDVVGCDRIILQQSKSEENKPSDIPKPDHGVARPPVTSTPPVSTTADEPEMQVVGDWDGVADCQEQRKEFQLSIRRSNGDSSYILDFVVDGRAYGQPAHAAKDHRLDHLFEFPDFRQRVNLPDPMGKVSYFKKSGRGLNDRRVYFHLLTSIWGGRDCVGHLVRREAPAISGGEFGRSAILSERCKAVKQWLEVAERERSLGRELKIRYSRGLAKFNPDASRSSLLFSEPAFSLAFGSPAADVPRVKLEATLKQVAVCAVLTEDEQLVGALGRHLFDRKSIDQIRYRMQPKLDISPWRPEDGLQPVSGFSLATVNNATSIALIESFSADLETWVRSGGWDLDSFLASRGDVTDLSVTHLSIALQRAELMVVPERRKVQVAKLTELRARILKKYDGVGVAESTRSGLRQHPWIALTKGEDVEMTTAVIQEFAGFASHHAETCGLPQRLADRIEVAIFVSSVRDKVAWSKIGLAEGIAGLAGKFGELGAFQAGADVSKKVGCSELSLALLGSIIDVLRFSRSDVQGGDPIFVRSCAVDYDLDRCRCLARVGEGVVSNINGRQFDRSIIASIITSNPFLGVKIGYECRIINY